MNFLTVVRDMNHAALCQIWALVIERRNEISRYAKIGIWHIYDENPFSSFYLIDGKATGRHQSAVEVNTVSRNYQFPSSLHGSFGCFLNTRPRSTCCWRHHLFRPLNKVEGKLGGAPSFLFSFRSAQHFLRALLLCSRRLYLNQTVFNGLVQSLVLDAMDWYVREIGDKRREDVLLSLAVELL